MSDPPSSFVPGPSSFVSRSRFCTLDPGVPTRRPDGQGAKDKGPRTKDQGRVPNNGTQTVRWLPIPNPTVGKAPTVATPHGAQTRPVRTNTKSHGWKGTNQ